MFLDYLSFVHRDIFVGVRVQACPRLEVPLPLPLLRINRQGPQGALLKFVVSYRAPTLPVTVAGATNPCQWPGPHLNMKFDDEN